MITFRQKHYNDPEKNPASYENSSGVIINSGGMGGNSVRGSNTQISASQMQTQQQEIMRQKTLQDIRTNQIRQEKYKGIQDRADANRARQVTAMTRAKEQASMAGTRDARDLERKSKVPLNPGLYKLPTTRNTPISSNNRTQIKK